MKKLIILVTVILLIALTGCGANASDNEESVEGPIVAQLSAIAGGKYILRITGKGCMPDWELHEEREYEEYISNITTVEIDDGVTTIGEYAFADFVNLTSVSIPDSVHMICDGAFYHCENLQSITIPYTVEYIGNGAFDECHNLSNIHVQMGNESYSDVNGVLFNADKTELIYYPNGKEESYTDPDDGTAIAVEEPTAVVVNLKAEHTLCFTGKGSMPDWEFCEEREYAEYISDITTVEIAEGITSIGDYAFSDFVNLTSITIPDSVTNIGECAFYHCENLQSITIPDGVSVIGDHAFAGCEKLLSFSIPDSVIAICDYAFAGCHSLSRIIVQKSNPYYCDIDGILFNKVKTKLLFCPNDKHGDFIIPDGVSAIGDHAFAECSNLTHIAIPDSVISIGTGAFESCDNLLSVTIPDSVAYIGDDAFKSCQSLESINIPGSVTSIGNHAFLFCTSLLNISIDKDNPYYSDIDGVLFNKAKTKLLCYPKGKRGYYIIPDGVTSIEDFAFEYCTILYGVTIPNSITSIGVSAFSYCIDLVQITIPDSVTSIGDSVFLASHNLKDIYYPGTEDQWNNIENIRNVDFLGATIHFNEY